MLMTLAIHGGQYFKHRIHKLHYDLITRTASYTHRQHGCHPGEWCGGNTGPPPHTLVVINVPSSRASHLSPTLSSVSQAILTEDGRQHVHHPPPSVSSTVPETACILHHLSLTMYKSEHRKNMVSSSWGTARRRLLRACRLVRQTGHFTFPQPCHLA